MNTALPASLTLHETHCLYTSMNVKNIFYFLNKFCVVDFSHVVFRVIYVSGKENHQMV